MLKGNINTLIDRGLYLIHARNAKVGVWLEKKKSFIISRWKFESNFLFEEFHYNTGAPYGTAWELEGPFEIVPPEKEITLNYLNKKEKEIQGIDEKIEAIESWQKSKFTNPLTCSVDSTHPLLKPVWKYNTFFLQCPKCKCKQWEGYIPEAVFESIDWKRKVKE